MLVLPTLMMANADGKKYFNNKEYKKALPLLEEKAQNGPKPAMYRLAHMYENGLGVAQDDKQAIYWFKQASSSYDYTIAMADEQEEQNKSFIDKIGDQFEPEISEESHSNNVDMIKQDTPETKNLAKYLLGDDYFGLQPYHSNFLLPISYSSRKYQRITSYKHSNNYTPREKEKYGKYNEITEVEFQISLQKPLSYDLFGWNENITVAYTQKVWWQLYSDSAPFRESNYSPEIFMSVPTSDEFSDEYGLRSMQYGFLHESNGQEGYRSRSWNRVYATANTQWQNLFVSARAWYIIPEDDKYDGYYDGGADSSGDIDPNASGADNPDIYKYMGYGDIKVNYLYGEHEFGGLFRYNFGMGDKNRGAVQLHYTYPLLNSESTFFYVKFFNGYGENLIDYNNCVTKTAVGFSFSRGIF